LFEGLNLNLFDPFREESIDNAMEMAIGRLAGGKQVNEEYAYNNWKTSIACEKYRQFYRMI
jgi:hypothetical protein